MDQCGDWSRAFHGVGQPDVQGNLRRLSSRAEEHQQRYHAEYAEAHSLGVKLTAMQHGVDIRKADRAEHGKHEQHSHYESRIAHPIYNECFLACVSSRFLMEIKSDQQI